MIRLGASTSTSYEVDQPLIVRGLSLIGEEAWSEASLQAEAKRASGDWLVGGPNALSPLVTTPIAWEYSSEGVCLLDLFGGISTGLAAVLQSGILVRRYLYVEKDETARRVSSLLEGAGP
ncbi:hypothetical protein AXG93_4034s1060 [Marchantia polymorpha subsp. ruderalis]|uniref:Uncharacterized protein n=1 Tax=Marchantia polymorpha subsp. ruderalis TaxID=1480154 RepID=A0A176WQ32_MARPO|nr:hypothetical protein AXG93_4034s1060 [Marchantia polymorpha subsp. ruderalis]